MDLSKHFENGWRSMLTPFLNSQQFKDIGSVLNEEQKAGRVITPKFDDTFRAFRECPYRKLKVVLLGLDPYPGKGVADGLAFSARDFTLDPPKSLQFILDAVEDDCYGGFGVGYNPNYLDADLTRWANQGVLLLNTALSTHQGLTGVHLTLWRPFIQFVFKTLYDYNSGLVFILLGTKAKEYKALIRQEANHILEAVHPAYCAYKGLKKWDCNKVFSKTNELLEQMNGEEAKILW